MRWHFPIGPTDRSTLEQLVQRYRAGAIGMDVRNPKMANKAHAQNHKAYKRLRMSERGRAAIIGLMGDDHPWVKCAAAAHSLAWSQEAAERTLEQLRDAEGRCSFEAKMVLQEFKKGRLTFDF